MEDKEATIQLYGQLGICGRREVFMGFAPANLLHSISFPDVLNEVTGEGYQRKFSRHHSQDFAQYIKQQGSGTIPLTFNLRPETAKHWYIAKDSNGLACLSIKAGLNRILAQVDCQHRLGSLQASDISLGFMSFIGLSLREEMQIFNIINGKAKGLNPSLLDYHEAKLSTDLAQQEPELYIALTLNNDQESQWFHQLDCGGEKTVGMTRKASLRTMRLAIRRFLYSSHALQSVSIDQIYGFVLNFWNAVASVLPDAWREPRKHFLTKGIGVYCLMSVASSIFRELNGDVTRATTPELIQTLKPLIGNFDWTNNGPLRGLGGEGGAKSAYDLIMASSASLNH